jgi:hypothetical protein
MSGGEEGDERVQSRARNVSRALLENTGPKVFGKGRG